MEVWRYGGMATSPGIARIIYPAVPDKESLYNVTPTRMPLGRCCDAFFVP